MTNYVHIFSDIAFAEPSDTIEEDLKNETSSIVDDIDFSELEQSLNELEFDYNLFGGGSFKELVLSIIGGETISLADFFNILLSGLKNTLKSILAPLTTILIIVLLCSMFNNMKSGKISSVGEIIYFVCFSVVVIIVASMSAKLLSQTKLGLERLQRQMNALFPILITLMTLVGGVASVKAYSPMLAFMSNAIGNIFIYVLLPLFTFSLVLAFIGNLSSNTRLNKLRGFISSTFKWIIGSVFAVFMTFLSLKGITAGATDGISIKATKFAIKNYIPLLGGYISDGFELIKAGGIIVKNATGFAAIFMLIATIVAPILSIAILELGLKLLAGIVEPLADNRSASLLYDVAKSLKLLVAIIVGVALMYFLTIFLITCSLSNFI